MTARHPFLDHPGPIAIAHRGGGLEAEENTLPAFRNAVELGFSHVELDVHTTRDGVVVVHHDPTFQRMTGDPRAVVDMTWDEVRALRTPGGSTIPRLEEVLEEFPGLYVNIEAKSDPVVEPLAELVARTGALWRIATGSFRAGRTQRLADLLGPGLCHSPAWLGVAQVRLAGLGLPMPAPRAHVLQVPERYRGIPVVVPGFLRAARRMGLPVQVWTVNEAAAMVRLLEGGVDAIMTDRPTLLREILKKRGEWRGPDA